jgi:RNA polymerase primary sigma factor
MEAMANSNFTTGGQKRKTRGSKSEGDSSMAKYFRDIATHPVLSQDEEMALAQDIEALEVEVWKRALAFAPATAYVAEIVSANLAETNPQAEVPAKQLAAVKRAASRVEKSKSSAAQKRLEKAAEVAATAVRAIDLDKDLIKLVFAELNAHADPRNVRKVRIGCSGKSRRYAKYLEHTRRAFDAANGAREAFVRANLRLVISIARRYSKGPMGLADLIQEGNLGLLKAVDRFDHRRGFRFSTYASWWIRHSVGRALADRGREVRVPVHMVDANYRLKKAKRDLIAKLGREPSDAELAREADMPLTKLQQMSTLLLGHPVSMSQPVSNDDDRPMVEVFQDPAAEESSPADKIDREILSRSLREVINDLSPIETDVVRRRFGLEGEQEQTLQEIADSYKRSRERIRQIQASALKKMRAALVRRDIRAA